MNRNNQLDLYEIQISENNGPSPEKKGNSNLRPKICVKTPALFYGS